MVEWDGGSGLPWLFVDKDAAQILDILIDFSTRDAESGDEARAKAKAAAFLQDFQVR